MIADQNFYDIFFVFFYPTASATAYGQMPKFVKAEHSATAEGEKCDYGPTLLKSDKNGALLFQSINTYIHLVALV